MRKGTAFHSFVRKQLDPAFKDIEVIVHPDDKDDVLDWTCRLMTKWKPPEGALWETEMFVDGAGMLAANDNGCLYTGHADVLWTEGDTAVVLDFKSGKHRLGKPHESIQLAAYGVPYAHSVGAKALKLGFYWARSAEFEWGELDQDGIRAAWERVKYAALLEARPVVGPHCKSCWHRIKKTCFVYQGDGK